MLEQTVEGLSQLPPDLKEIAEEMALAMMSSELKEDRIPPDQSGQIASEHKAANTDEWLRAQNAAVSALLALRRLGYRLTRS